MAQSNVDEELLAMIAWHSEYMLYTVAGHDGGTVNRLREHAETTTLNSLKKYLSQDRKQHELDAEIRALEFAWDSTDLMVKERIAELKAEREQL